jgi:cell division protein FtsI (penicillin-binding protein 3)
VTDMFEPGSTMKTFVMAAAIEKKKIEPNTKVFGEFGSYKIGKRVIREADAKHHFGWITATEVLAYSSNIGSTKIAQIVGEDDLREAYLRFGFGEPSGVDLPGEARGMVQPLPWREHLLANVSFGHGISATALQVANAYASVANGGWLKRPYIMKSIRDSETGEVSEGKPKTIRRVLGDDAAAKVRLMLSATTIGDGTGLNARVPGFPVAGKTGTAQRVLENGRGYEPGAYVSSFAGFLPANDPKFVIFVSLDKPRKNYYGGAVAAPVFARIARFAVSRAGLSPVLISAKNVIASDAAFKARNPKAEAVAWRAERGLAAEDIQASRAPFAAISGAAVTGFSDLLKSRTDMKSDEKPDDVASKFPIVPDVVGLSLREAMESFGANGIAWRNVSAHGQGFVKRQGLAPGARWVETKGRKIDLELTFTQ